MSISAISSSYYDYEIVLTSPFLTKKVDINSTTAYDEETVQESFSRDHFPLLERSQAESPFLSYDVKNIGYVKSTSNVSDLINGGFSPAEAVKIQKAQAAYGLNNIGVEDAVSRVSSQVYIVE